MGLACLGAVAWAWTYPFLADMKPVSRALSLSGAAIGTAGALAATRVLAVLGARMLRPRRGRIELRDDRLVAFDRWLLREPLEVFRSEIEAIERFPKLSLREFTAFPSRRTTDIANRSVVLGIDTRPNVTIQLRQPRLFAEAIAVPSGRGAWQPISRGAVGDIIHFRVRHRTTSAAALDAWMDSARHTHSPSRSAEQECRSALVGAALWLSATAGFVLYCIALAISAPAT